MGLTIIAVNKNFGLKKDGEEKKIIKSITLLTQVILLTNFSEKIL